MRGEDYLKNVVPVHEQWMNILPTIRDKSLVAILMGHALSNGILGGTDFGEWELLKASLTFKRHHRREKFVWQVIGRQLQFIKATTARNAGDNTVAPPIPVIPKIYRFLRPNAKSAQRNVDDDEQESGGRSSDIC